MSDIKKFEHSQLGLSLRVIEKDGEPWFVATDLAKAMGHRDANAAVRGVDPDDKGTNQICTPRGGVQTVTTVNESGLYAVILRSDKPEARAFRKWVTSEVLPSIRKGGMYMTEKTATQAVEDPAAFMAKALLMAQDVIAQKDAKLAAQAPKVEALEKLAADDQNYTVTAAWKFLQNKGLFKGNREAMFGWLNQIKVIYKSGGIWLGHQHQIDRGIVTNGMATDARGELRPQVTITAKGLTKLAELLARKLVAA